MGFEVPGHLSPWDTWGWRGISLPVVASFSEFKFMSYIRFPWLYVHLLRLVRESKLHQVCVAVVMPYVESKGALDWVSWKQVQRWRVVCRVYWEVLSGVIPVGRWGRQDWIDKKGPCNWAIVYPLWDSGSKMVLYSCLELGWGGGRALNPWISQSLPFGSLLWRVIPNEPSAVPVFLGEGCLGHRQRGGHPGGELEWYLGDVYNIYSPIQYTSAVRVMNEM